MSIIYDGSLYYKSKLRRLIYKILFAGLVQSCTKTITMYNYGDSHNFLENEDMQFVHNLLFVY